MMLKRTCLWQVPDEILHDEALNAAIGVLPANYSFEVRAMIHSCMQGCKESLSRDLMCVLDCTDTQDGVAHKADGSQARGSAVSRGPLDVCLCHRRHPGEVPLLLYFHLPMLTHKHFEESHTGPVHLMCLSDSFMRASH